MNLVVSLLAGLMLGLGLGIANMTNPAVVLGFLDLTGKWDLTLMFVMAGAIGVHLAMYWLIIKKRTNPILAKEFFMPDNLNIDTRIVLGAIIFGIGWGMSGICPGAAYINMGTFDIRIFYFVAMMLIGNFTFRIGQSLLTK
jgi:uncharacterized protein